MAELWFWLLATMLGVYIVLDGFDFGAGILHFVIARSPGERASILSAIGPVWDGNEVWLIAAGGSLFAAFPALYAITFSGFYLPLTLTLWLLLFRALGIELRHQLNDAMWQAFWDVAFSAASLLLSIVFGAALGNLVRGVPLGEDGNFFEPLWTDFRVGTETGILDWYTLLVASTAVISLSLHGALWLALKSAAPLAERADRGARTAFWPCVALAALTALATFAVQPQLSANLKRYPLGLSFPLASALGLFVARANIGKRPLAAFLGSSTHILAQVLAAAFAIFPNALSARIPSRHLSLHTAAAPEATLAAMFAWWLPGMLLAVSYSYFSYSRMPRTIEASDAH